MEKTLRAGLLQLKLQPDEEQIRQLLGYADAMLEKNRVMNLTAITEPEQVAELHLVDSATLLCSEPLKGKRVIDVGCGAGLPGVPLKILEPTIQLTLLDSLGKRMDWLRSVLPELNVQAEVVTARAEEEALKRREQYDVAVSRAVARLNILSELCLPFVRVGGVFLAMKGAAAEEELHEAEQAISALGGTLERLDEYAVGGALHRVAVIRKTAPTPKQYPRRFAKIKQQPL